MYARITPTRVDPAREAEVVRLAEDRLSPALQRLPGFRHYFVTLDRDAPGRGYTITVWDTREQAKGLREALSGVIAEFRALGVELEASQVHEVLVRAWSPPMGLDEHPGGCATPWKVRSGGRVHRARPATGLLRSAIAWPGLWGQRRARIVGSRPPLAGPPGRDGLTRPRGERSIAARPDADRGRLGGARHTGRRRGKPARAQLVGVRLSRGGLRPCPNRQPTSSPSAREVAASRSRTSPSSPTTP